MTHRGATVENQEWSDRVKTEREPGVIVGKKRRPEVLEPVPAEAIGKMSGKGDSLSGQSK